MRILLVDDEEELVATLAERLEMRGMAATWVTNYRAALQAVDQQSFDIALLDVRLPEMNGLDLKRLIEARAAGHEVHYSHRSWFGRGF